MTPLHHHYVFEATQEVIDSLRLLGICNACELLPSDKTIITDEKADIRILLRKK